MPDDTILIPVGGQGVDTMADTVSPQFERLHDQNMAGMGQAITMFQNDAVKISKAADYSYLQGKDLVSLTEAVGTREVSSERNPGGPKKPE